MSKLYSIDQLKWLSDRFEEDGYTAEQVNLLGQSGRLRSIKAVLDGQAEIKLIQTESTRTLEEIVIDSLVRVDRTVKPTYPNWMKKVMHPELESTGPAEFDSDKLEQWLHPSQIEGVVKGQMIYDHLKSENMLSSCLGLRDLEEIQKKGIAHFRRNFNGKYVFGWKSIVRYDDDNLRVPFLCEDGGEVGLNWHWLGNDWYSTSPALRFAS
jgi:hypothetical protein